MQNLTLYHPRMGYVASVLLLVSLVLDPVLPAALLSGPAAAATPVEVRTIPSRRGVTESFLLVRPDGPPTASLILLAGDGGELALSPEGIGHLGGNFLVRNRQRFAQEGFLVAVLDVPSDRTSLWNFRTTSDHAQDLKAAIAAMREIAPVPVWLVGTSMGTLSAANGAARLKEGGPDGIVLTSSVSVTTKSSGESIRHVSLDKITVPVLIVHHRHDGCQSSPYAFATYLPGDLKNARAKELLTFDGGSPATSGPCEARSAHGYLGIEPEVVSAISAWIRAH
ncbi:MAG TPA: alpha/beta hydrolase [Candidatus Bathyarchaeia archaeon]|nr:alpha/beta hydrolase [Candidatus Bathyarchaeia archaeon]